MPTTQPNKPAHDREVEEQVLKFVQAYSPLFFYSLALSLFGLVVLMYSSSQNPIVLAWFVVICLILKATRNQRVGILNAQISHKARINRAIWLNIVDGVSISSVLGFILSSDNLTRIMMVVALLITTTISIVSCAGYRKLFIAFNAVIVAASVVACLMLVSFYNGPKQFYLMALLAVLTFWVQLNLSQGVFTAIKEAKVANLHNKATNLQLKEAVFEARKANESKTRFLASASHDLRQPISVLSLSILSLQMLSKDTQKTEIINNMDSAIQDIDAQLSSLLDISKLDAGIVEVQARVIDLVPFLKRIVEPHIDSSDHKVKVSYESKIRSAKVELDEQLFSRVIGNLLSNAKKYTEEGKVEVVVSGGREDIFVNIIDTGLGISRVNLDKVFDEFYQIDNPHRDSQKGLGLGLSIVQRLCALMQVKLSIQSQLNRGTAVTLTIRKTEALLLTQTASLKPTHATRSLHVLALDNERAILDALESLLLNMGHRVTSCESSQDALKLFMRDNFDLALIDYRLPGDLNGVDVIREIKKISPSMPCFLVTGDNTIEQDELEIEVIYKPITQQKLSLIFD